MGCLNSIMSHQVISLKCLMKDTGVTDEQLDQKCSNLHLDDLSEHIVEYQKYGPQLGLTEPDIKEIEQNPRIFHSMKLITAAVFKKWHAKCCSKATYRVLVGVALKLNDGAGAERICQICAEGVSVDVAKNQLQKEVRHEPQISNRHTLGGKNSSHGTSDSAQLFRRPAKTPSRGRNEPVLTSDLLPAPDKAIAVINKLLSPVVVYMCVGVMVVIVVTGLVWTSIPKPSKNIILKMKGAQPANKPTKLEEKWRPAQTDLKEEEHLVPPEFDAMESDCEMYSKQLLSQTTFSYNNQHRIKGQVELFDHTIHLTGRASFSILPGDPYEYEASALDMTHDTREHNTGANSRVSLEDAVEKALVKICKILRRKGFGELSSR